MGKVEVKVRRFEVTFDCNQNCSLKVFYLAQGACTRVDFSLGFWFAGDPSGRAYSPLKDLCRKCKGALARRFGDRRSP